MRWSRSLLRVSWLTRFAHAKESRSSMKASRALTLLCSLAFPRAQAGRWSKDGKWIPASEYEHWHEGPLGQVARDPTGHALQIFREIFAIFSSPHKHRHPMAPPWWMFLLIYTCIVILVLAFLLRRMLTQVEQRYAQQIRARQHRPQRQRRWNERSERYRMHWFQ